MSYKDFYSRTYRNLIRSNYLPDKTGGPADISDLVLWVDAELSPITIDSGKVSAWNDISGNGNHYSQTNATNRPVLANGVLSGRDAIRFQNTGVVLTKQFLTRSGVLIPDQDDNLTVFIVTQTSDRSIQQQHLWGQYFSSTSFLHNHCSMFLNKGGFGLNTILYDQYTPSGGGVSAPDNSIVNNTPYIYSLISEDTAAADALKLYLNGVLKATNPRETYTGGTATLSAIGAAQRTDFNFGLQGDIGTIILYNKTLNETEHQSVLDYLSSLYGIPV